MSEPSDFLKEKKILSQDMTTDSFSRLGAGNIPANLILSLITHKNIIRKLYSKNSLKITAYISWILSCNCKDNE